MTRPAQKSRGFAMLMALAMLALVAATVLLLTRQFSYEIKRTQLTTADAQLSQLLLAGAQDVLQRSRGWGETVQPASWQMQLPKQLSTPGAKLSVEMHPTADGLEATIEAYFEPGVAIQTLHLHHTPSGWSAASVELAGAK